VVGVDEETVAIFGTVARVFVAVTDPTGMLTVVLDGSSRSG
jgi:hypothetical protein